MGWSFVSTRLLFVLGFLADIFVLLSHGDVYVINVKDLIYSGLGSSCLNF